ncbi:septal ring lytic transglycosylase RlpA family protein [Desulfonatronum thioautotrophicum]|uniref:septal ring lytic transglycosylase RlpA family protein n=1 Tax=Desulfonatronum thioautotrophicum TaxID=617001 RepID=UPI00069C92DF|nr:septal ring lytic transglycosylase RlpA family protein [Desulfonatronum thioautotrophicum]
MLRSDATNPVGPARPAGPTARLWKQVSVCGPPRAFSLLSLLLGTLLLMSCAATPEPRRLPPPSEPPRPTVSRPQPPPEPQAPLPPTARPYTVLGQTYHPLTTADGFSEVGIASWYGPKFHAKRTASGEVYNMYDLTAAHRILPMQTKIRVTNLENNKSVILRVNDRGPFVGDRVVDLSYRAAQELDVIRPGTAKVRVEALGRWPGGIPGRFFVQVGSFTQRENADRLMRELRGRGYPESRVVRTEIDGQTFWRVQAGEFGNLDTAKDARGRIARQTPGAFVIAD